MYRLTYLLLVGTLLIGIEMHAQIEPHKYPPTLERGKALFHAGAFFAAADTFRTARIHAPVDKYPIRYEEASQWIIRSDSSLIVLLSRREQQAQRAKESALQARNEAVKAQRLAEYNEQLAIKAEMVADSAREQAEADRKASIARYLAFGSIKANSSDTALHLAYYALASEVDTFYPTVRQAFGDAVYRQSHTQVYAAGDSLLVRDFICSPKSDRVLVLAARQLKDTVAGPDRLHAFSLGTDASDHRLSLDDVLTRYALPANYRVSTIAFAKEGRRFVTGSTDGRLVLWATHSPTPLAVAELAAPVPIHTITFSDSQRFLIATESGDIARWSTEMDRLKAVDTITPATERAPVYAIGFSADGSRFYTRGAAPAIDIWSGREGTAIARLAPIPFYAYEAAFSSDGSQVLVADATGSIGWWDIVSGQLREPLPTTPERPTHFAFAPGADQFYVAGKAGHLIIRETGRNQQVTFQFGTEITDADFTPRTGTDSLLTFLQTSLLVGFTDGSVRLVETSPTDKMPYARDVENRILMNRKITSGAAIRKVAFAPDGRHWLALGEAGHLTICRNYAAAYEQMDRAKPELSRKQYLRFFGKVPSKKMSR